MLQSYKHVQAMHVVVYFPILTRQSLACKALVVLVTSVDRYLNGGHRSGLSRRFRFLAEMKFVTAFPYISFNFVFSVCHHPCIYYRSPSTPPLGAIRLCHLLLAIDIPLRVRHASRSEIPTWTSGRLHAEGGFNPVICGCHNS